MTKIKIRGDKAYFTVSMPARLLEYYRVDIIELTMETSLFYLYRSMMEKAKVENGWTTQEKEELR